MEFKKIELQDKEIIDEFLLKFQPEASELTFTNLFAWSGSKKTEFCIVDSYMLIRNKDFYYTPLGPDAPRMIAKLLKKYPSMVFDRVEESVASEVVGYEAVGMREHSDYVYLLEDMRKLPGKKYRAKRQFIRRIIRLSPRTERVRDNIKECIALNDSWYDSKDASPEIRDEHEAVKKVLLNFSSLDVEGICIRIDSRIEAFAIGEPLNALTYVDHFEKANPDIKGLYQYLLNEFSVFIPENFKLLNREQDLGIEGLKKAKKSYYPVKLVHKFRIFNKKHQSDSEHDN